MTLDKIQNFDISHSSTQAYKVTVVVVQLEVVAMFQLEVAMVSIEVHVIALRMGHCQRLLRIPQPTEQTTTHWAENVSERNWKTAYLVRYWESNWLCIISCGILIFESDKDLGWRLTIIRVTTKMLSYHYSIEYLGRILVLVFFWMDWNIPFTKQIVAISHALWNIQNKLTNSADVW